jgi:hypothetical protein
MATATAIVAALASTSLGRRVHIRPRRNGSSMNRQLPAATTIETSPSAIASSNGKGSPVASEGRTRIGQCHR